MPRQLCATCGDGETPTCAKAIGSTSHFNKGLCDVAFVFSAPGTLEDEAPVSGHTGESLDFALERLHRERPRQFPHRSRYGYRITNSVEERMSGALGSGRTEPKKHDVLLPSNVIRVKRDLEGMKLVILCGLRPGWLAEKLCPEFTVITWSHTGDRALWRKFGDVVQDDRRMIVARPLMADAWAEGLLAEMDRLSISL